MPASKITVYEQFPDFLAGTRVNVRKWQLPAGVITAMHNNTDQKMPEIAIFQHVKTKYARIFTDATAVINITMIKDHSIAGYTGTMKNMTHGNVNTPHLHHANNASPQIAVLYNHPIVTSRVRLHITDAFKIKIKTDHAHLHLHRSIRWASKSSTTIRRTHYRQRYVAPGYIQTVNSPASTTESDSSDTGVRYGFVAVHLAADQCLAGGRATGYPSAAPLYNAIAPRRSRPTL